MHQQRQVVEALLSIDRHKKAPRSRGENEALRHPSVYRVQVPGGMGMRDDTPQFVRAQGGGLASFRTHLIIAVKMSGQLLARS